jgi:His/Glu/Gln/Arg/opine family amino acid ABC transporter permease subunit
MTSISEPRSGGLPGSLVNYDEPPVKPPPLLAVGPLAWIRNNLFSSPLDSLLTIVAGVVIVVVLSSFFVWAIGQANWFVVTFNLRLLMLGRFAADTEWRVALLAAITAFGVGLSLAAWTRISRRAALIMVLALAFVFVAPPLIDATTRLSPAYVAAGNSEIASGAAKETPQPQLGFIARAGETVSVRMADQYTTSDQSLGEVYGFSDKAASLLANAASNRLDTAARIDSFNQQLSSDLLTDNQRARLTTQLKKLTVPDPITDTFLVNQGAINVRILRGTTLEPLVSGTITTGSQPVSATLPEDGWYILEKIPANEDDKGSALLEVQGIEPILERQFTRSGDLDIDGNVTAAERISQYVRMTDNYTTEELRPAPDGKNVAMAIIIDNAYRGNHTFTDYLRLFVGPFLDVIKLPLLLLLCAGTLGYVAGRMSDRFASTAEKPRKTSRRFATWLLIALPVIMFGLIYGVGSILPLTDTRRWGGLLLTIMLTLVGTVVSFPIGIALALGRRSDLPVVKAASTIYIEIVRGVPLITVLFMAQLLLPLVNPSLAEMPNVFRAMIAITLFNAAYLAENIRGGLQSIPSGQQEAAKALGLNSLQITLYITLPQALRAVLPALVGMVISLFKDTSLVAIVGLLDLTGMAQNIVTQTEFIGLRRETLLFITLIYFGVSYAIAAVSRRIESSGAGAARMQQV